MHSAIGTAAIRARQFKILDAFVPSHSEIR
jgi:hypothetical protein